LSRKGPGIVLESLIRGGTLLSVYLNAVSYYSVILWLIAWGIPDV